MIQIILIILITLILILMSVNLYYTSNIKKECLSENYGYTSFHPFEFINVGNSNQYDCSIVDNSNQYDCANLDNPRPLIRDHIYIDGPRPLKRNRFQNCD